MRDSHGPFGCLFAFVNGISFAIDDARHSFTIQPGARSRTFLRDRAARFAREGRFCEKKQQRLQIVLSRRAEKIEYFARLDDLDAVLDVAGNGI